MQCPTAVCTTPSACPTAWPPSQQKETMSMALQTGVGTLLAYKAETTPSVAAAATERPGRMGGRSVRAHAWRALVPTKGHRRDRTSHVAHAASGDRVSR